jgi:hypothetical protein
LSDLIAGLNAALQRLCLDFFQKTGLENNCAFTLTAFNFFLFGSEADTSAVVGTSSDKVDTGKRRQVEPRCQTDALHGFTPAQGASS